MTKLGFLGDSNQLQYSPIVAEKFSTIIANAYGAIPILDAVSGSGAYSVLQRVPAMMAQGPSAVFVCIGTNELATAVETGIPHHVMMADYLVNMGSIMTAIRPTLTSPVVPVIFSPPATQHPQGQLRLPSMVDALRNLCASRDVIFFDLHAAMMRSAYNLGYAAWLAEFDTLFLPSPLDFWHLSAPVGQAFVADAFLRSQFRISDVLPPTPPPQPPPGPDGLIPQGYGTAIGDMLPLAAAFDGVKVVAAANCAKKAATSVTSYIGKSFPAPKMIRGFRYWASSDQGVSQGNNTVELQCWVKSGAAPTSDTNGTYVGGSAANMADAPGLFFEKQDCAPTAADHVWVRAISTGELAAKYCGEVEFYEPSV